MKLLDTLSQTVLLRTLNRGLQKVDQRLAEQNGYLKRLADHFAPQMETNPLESGIRSVEYVEERGQALILEYVEKTLRDTGREPTEDEILQFLDGVPVGMKE